MNLEKDNEVLTYEIQFVELFFEYYKKQQKSKLMEWIKTHPGYWTEICEGKIEDLSPEMMATIMFEIKKLYMPELEMVWLWKCRDVLDIEGHCVQKRDGLTNQPDPGSDL